MGHQNDFYRKAHPEQFSDSIVVKKGKLDRDFFDFFLETLTSKNLDKTFEEFCRGLAEAEICPNLMPQTGPTGGGDSKVDSETYPVSNQIAELWYYGHAAASERWAFAISAKKDWKSKVKSDVAKIVTVNSQENRGYTKIFFMSNQYISDKKRAETEDELRNQYGLDIRIMDRTWILDKVLSNPKNIEMTIKVFGFSDSFYDEIQPGTRDLERRQEFERNEQKISDTQTKQSELVLLVRRNVILARELGYTQTQVLGLIERSVKISSEYGSAVDYAKALYEAAWTMYWWYEDKKRYYDFYIKFEKVVVENYNVNLFANLITLWINLYTLSQSDTTIAIDEHTRILKEEYARYTNDSSKPNTTIEAKAAYQLCRFFLGDDPDVIVDDIITILEKSSGHLDLDLRPLCHAIQEFPVFEDTKRYVEMFERSVDIMSERKQNIEASNLLASRGRKLKEKKPYDTNIHTIPIINIPAWNNAKWIGVMFLADLYHLQPPLLSFVFTSESGRTIFEEWHKTIGKIDSQNQIAIRIIKGIDRNHPFWYRVAVGVGNYTGRPDNEPFILTLPSRCLTMQPNSDANLKMFENELKRFRHYSLCPSYMPDRVASPVTQETLSIQKGIDSIVIYEACDIPPNDYLAMCAILPTDEPIIPAGKEKSPVVDMINKKRNMR